MLGSARRRGRADAACCRGIHFRAIRGRHRLGETPDRFDGIPSRWRYRGTGRGKHRREGRPPLANIRVRRRHLGAETRRNAASRSVVRRCGQHWRTRPVGHIPARPTELVRSRLGDGTRASGGDLQLRPASQQRNPPCRRHSGRERRRARRSGRAGCRWLLGVHPDERRRVRRSSEARPLRRGGYDHRSRRISIQPLGSGPGPRDGLQPRWSQRSSVLERGPL